MICHTVLKHDLFYGWVHSLKTCTLVLMLALIGGCGGILIQFGRMPETSVLETSLQPGISERSDVSNILGAPRTIGGAWLAGHDSPRDMWVYYYEEATLSDAQRIFLFVFFREERYDGYLWFSSLQNASLSIP